MGDFFGRSITPRGGTGNLRQSGSLHGQGDHFFGQAPVASTSPPAGTWTESTFGGGGVFPTCIANSPGRLVLQTTLGTPQYSTDGGRTWTNSSTFIGSSGIGAAFEAGNFAIVGAALQQLYYSTDGGVTWTFSAFFNFPGGASAMVSNGTNLMVVLFDGTAAAGNYATSSNHGVTWVQHNTFTGAARWGNSAVQNVALWDGTQFVALATATGTGLPIICTSTDGIHWTSAAFLAGGTQSIAFGAGIYMGCAGGGDSNVYSASTPAGIASATPVNTGLTGVSTLLYDGVHFFAFDTLGRAARSTTGATWTIEETHIPHISANGIATAGFDSTNQTVVAFVGFTAGSSPYPYSVRSGL